MFYLKDCDLPGCEGEFEIMRDASPYEDLCVGYFSKTEYGWGMELTTWLTVADHIAIWTVVSDKMQHIRYLEKNA